MCSRWKVYTSSGPPVYSLCIPMELEYCIFATLVLAPPLKSTSVAFDDELIL
jgi:hypothetical protein